ncbi:hypothetical protein B0H17DRAFT_1335113, partial [Mycena rosella]
MSLVVDGVSVTSISYASSPRTALSPSFISKLPHGSLCPLLFTSAAPDIDSASFLLDCVCLETSSHDVVLGSDWASYFRESLIASGKYVSHGFDAWMFFSSRLIGTSTVVSSQTPATVDHTSRLSLGATSHTSPPVRSTTGRSVHSGNTETEMHSEIYSELRTRSVPSHVHYLSASQTPSFSLPLNSAPAPPHSSSSTLAVR